MPLGAGEPEENLGVSHDSPLGIIRAAAYTFSFHRLPRLLLCSCSRHYLVALPLCPVTSRISLDVIHTRVGSVDHALRCTLTELQSSLALACDLDSQGIVLEGCVILFKRAICKARRKTMPTMSGQTDVEGRHCNGRVTRQVTCADRSPPLIKKSKVSFWQLASPYPVPCHLYVVANLDLRLALV